MGLLSEVSSSHKMLHVHLLYCLLGILLTYIVVDHFVYHSPDDPLLACLCNCPCTLSSTTATARKDLHRVEATAPRPKLCANKEDFYDDDEESGWMHERGTNAAESKEDKGILLQKVKANADNNAALSGDAWHQMKWVGKPASCLVKGRLIERLDKEYNFRRGYALQFVQDVEDKTHLLPWLLASKLDLNRRKRRVYIDLGANRFSTSVRWFLRMYPCDFTEIHAFEVNPRFWKPPKRGFDEERNGLARASNNSVLVKQTPGIPQWMLDRINIHFKLASHRDDEKKGHVNITRFMKEELKLKSEDAVVVKMDIEGSEWPLLKAWMEDPEMPSIVDELFLEAHYAHPTMSAFGWDSFAPITRRDAKHLIGDLRWKGFYAHAWP